MNGAGTCLSMAEKVVHMSGDRPGHIDRNDSIAGDRVTIEQFLFPVKKKRQLYRRMNIRETGGNEQANL